MVSACICIFAGNSPAYVMIMWYVRVGHSPSEVSTTNYITILQINCSVINSRILLTTTAYNLILSIIILQSCTKLIHNVVSYLHRSSSRTAVLMMQVYWKWITMMMIMIMMMILNILICKRSALWPQTSNKWALKKQ